MTDEETKEIKDPTGLLAAYEQAKKDLVELRRENKQLKKVSEDDDAWKKRALSAETKLALQGQGIKDVDRLMPYIGTEGIDFDENGAVVGLDERLKTLKADLPELFDAKRRVGGGADIFADSSIEVKADPFREAIHNALHGSR